jgi:hypothetical protein
MPTKIDVPVINSLHKRDVVVKECYLQLHDNYIEYKNVSEYEADDYVDQEGIWKIAKSNFRWVRMRSDISTVDMYYDNPEEKWMVCLEFKGVNNCTGWLYDNPNDALKLYNKLCEYFVNSKTQ